MKKLIAILFIFTFLSGTVLYAGGDKESGNPPVTTAITGKVIDNNTMEELAGVTVEIEGTDIKAYTDIEGNFTINDVQPGNYNLTFTYISYKEKELKDITANPADGSELKIKLEQTK